VFKAHTRKDKQVVVERKHSHFMKKDPLVYIDDIRDSIETIKRYTAGITKATSSNPPLKRPIL
jgi:hypothetical protein